MASSETAAASSAAPAVICHYEVLGVSQDADAATIKKAHRKLALKWHPDKNVNDQEDDTTAVEQFRLVQQAYECLSDAAERKWYDDHRDAILRGWSAGGTSGGGGAGNGGGDMLFDVEPFIFAGCYRGFGDDEHGFFAVYKNVFFKLYQEEELGASKDSSNNNNASSVAHLATDFGTSTSSWQEVAAFYNAWETFSSGLNFCWADPFDFDALKNEAPNRRVRRAMEEENRKARKVAKRARNDEIAMLVRFVKKRDVRVIQRQQEVEQERLLKLQQQKLESEQRKKDTAQARESWRVQAEQEMVQAQEEDRLAGRLRLADLEDDYDYGGKKGKKKKSKKKSNNNNKNEKKDDDDQAKEDLNDIDGDDDDSNDEKKESLEKEPAGEDANGETTASTTVIDEGDDAENVVDANDYQKDDDADSLSDSDGIEEGNGNKLPAAAVDEAESSGEEESSEDEQDKPDFWYCECCRKEFKSEAQLQNHVKSKKHKEAFKRFEKKLAELEKEMLAAEDE